MNIAKNNTVEIITKVAACLLVGAIIGALVSLLIYFAEIKLQLTLSFIYIFFNLMVITFSIAWYRIRAGITDLFSPFILPNFLFIVIYVLKPIYILVTG